MEAITNQSYVGTISPTMVTTAVPLPHPSSSPSLSPYSIDISALESYLVNIKSKISDLEDDIKHPVWWNDFISNMNHVGTIDCKLDQYQLDLNCMKDAIYNTSTNTSTTTSTTINPFNILNNEIEGLKAIVRRIDINLSKDKFFYTQLKTLQSQVKSLDKITVTVTNGTLQNLIKDEFLLEMGRLKVSIDATIDTIRSSTTSNQEQISELSQLHSKTVNKVSKLKADQSAINIELQSLGTSCHRNSSCIADILYKLTCYHVYLGANKYMHITTNFHKMLVRSYYNRWRIFTVHRNGLIYYNRSKIADVLLKIVMLTHIGLKRIRRRFIHWKKSIVSRRMLDSLAGWKEVWIKNWYIKASKPSKDVYFRLWHRNTIYIQIQSKLKLAGSNNDEQLEAILQNFPSYIHSLRRDSVSNINIITYVVSNLGTSNRGIRDTVTYMNNELSTVKDIIQSLLKETEKVVTSSANKTNSQILASRRLLDDEMQAMKTEVNDKIEDVTSFLNRSTVSLNTLNSRVDKTIVSFVQQENKLEQLLLLQGKIMARVDALEGGQLDIFSRLDRVDEILDKIDSDINDVKDDINRINRSHSNHINVYNNSVVANTEQFKILHKSIKEINSTNSETHTKMNKLASNISKLSTTMKPIIEANTEPVPADLFQIYLLYEEQLLSLYANGVVTDRMDGDVSVLLSKFVDKYATYLAIVSDLQVLSNMLLIDGFNKDGDMMHNTSNTGNAYTRRQELLTSFYEGFVALLMEKDSNPGLVKATARVTFNRRFQHAIDCALNKRIGVVTEAGYVDMVHSRYSNNGNVSTLHSIYEERKGLSSRPRSASSVMNHHSITHSKLKHMSENRSNGVFGLRTSASNVQLPTSNTFSLGGSNACSKKLGNKAFKSIRPSADVDSSSAAGLRLSSIPCTYGSSDVTKLERACTSALDESIECIHFQKMN